MKQQAKPSRNPVETREKLVAAAQRLMLRQGYSATSVDQVCAEAGLTKGSFFHHFPSKDAIGRAAVDAWGAMGTRLYSEAWRDPDADPLDQLDRLIDIMVSFTRRDEPTLCMVGMLSQELSLTDPAMREACAGHLADWTTMVARLLTEAKHRHPSVEFDPERVGWLCNSVWQGSMLIAKTRGAPETIVSNLELIRAYVAGLFPTVRRPAQEPA
jgi:TetR/AcrR family transcriptional repressor of nem operon